jgi:hypothetical protein
MAQILAQAKIQDFDQFWSTFTGPGAEQRRKYDSQGSRVFRSEDDPKEIWVLFDWSPERYRAFLDDPDSQQIMQQAGLEAPPQGRAVQEVGTVES